MDNIGVDIIIVTKNRYRELLRCVKHICVNSLKPINLIIIDSSKNLNKQVKNELYVLSKESGIELKYAEIPHKGVGYSRNLGLQKVESSHFAFIDDDEYMPKFWMDRVSRLFGSKKDVQVFAGPKIPLLKNNYWHRVTRSLIEYEFNYVGSVETIPSGNSIYLTSFVKKHKVNFDERFKQCSEDQAFSYELRKHKANILFHKSIWVKHDLRRSLIPFARQWFYYGVNKCLYQRLYLGSGSLFQPSKFFISLRNFKKTFPYVGSFRNVDILPGIIFLNVVFLIGYLYSFTGLHKIIIPK